MYYRGLGRFGKSSIAPGPTPVGPNPTSSPQITIATTPSVAAPPVAAPEVQLNETSEEREIRLKLEELRAAVASQRQSKEDEIKHVQEMNRKQAAYTRDTVQFRPSGAGYATDSEKAMGARTGYEGWDVIKPKLPWILGAALLILVVWKR